MDKKERQIIAEAISSCQGRITAAEIVSLTGLPVLCVNRCLNSLAYECGAHLEVNSEGRVSYLFPANFAWLYRTTFIQKFAKLLGRVVGGTVQFLLRLTFGTILFLSIAFIYTICFFVLEVVSVFSNMENAAGTMRREFFDLLFSFLKLPGAKAKQPDKKKTRMPAFMENCFAFLFGPKDPNAGMDANIWRSIADLIRSNGGVVIPEQLRIWSNTLSFENFELNALVRLDGMPLVTEEGNILYYFPGLISKPEKQEVKNLEQMYLKERNWHFSGVGTKDLLPVLALALLNLIGCNLAYFGLHALPTLVNKPFFYWSITILWIYGNTFLVFPLFRIFLCALRNHKITDRNVTRKLLAEELLYPSEETQKLLDSSYQASAEISRKASEAKVVYTTEKDALEQFILEPLI